MKKALKFVLHGLAVLVVSPTLLAYWTGGCFFAAEKNFSGWVQFYAVLPGVIGNFLRRAFLVGVLPRCALDSWIGFGTLFSHPTASLGRRVYIGNFCSIGDVDLADDVLVASHVSIMNGTEQHGIDRLDVPIREQPGNWKRISIGEGSWIGERAVVMADVGKGCVIGAASVVTKPVPDFAIAVGVPAKVVRYRNQAESEE